MQMRKQRLPLNRQKNLSMASKNDELMTFGEHLDVLRKMLFRVIGLTLVMAVGVFCMKDQVFAWLLAPHDSSFCTFQAIETVCRWIGVDFQFEPFNVTIISTELSAQFMTHLSTSVYLGLLLASPYVVYELFAFIAPALYEREKRVARVAVVVVYVLFFLGVLMSYFVLFPISFRFLATYQVSGMIQNTITLDSYISTFTTLTFMMGLVFQLPVVTYFGGRLGIVSHSLLKHYRRHAIIVIVVIAAFITPPDVFTLILVALPMYLLYEVSIWLVKDTN